MERIDPRLVSITDCLYRVAAKAVVIEKHKLLVVLENEDWYSLPGGGVDYGEPLQLALKRELSEELNIQQENVQVDENPFHIAHG